MPFTKSQTGAKSAFGGRRSSKTVMPWGRNVVKTVARSVNSAGVGKTSARNRASGSSVRRATPNKALWSMSYPTNDPLAWPVVGGNPNPLSGMTQAKADLNNLAVNHAFQRGGYAG